MTRGLILGSGSTYRRELLERLGLDFDVMAPHIDETPHTGEPPDALVARLAREKAAAVAKAHPDAVVIGSDQVAVLDGQILGKPVTVARARAQLANASGREVGFLTGVCVRSARLSQSHLDVTRVVFRTLSDSDIERYVKREEPLDCAGSFKAERLGISLFERIESSDPTGLIGLPLIWLSAALRAEDYRLP
ncbi:MAG: Maf family protein [Pseudomonadota bacterium]